MITLLMMMVGAAEAHDVRLCGQWTPTFREGTIDDTDGEDHNSDGIVDNDVPDYMNSNTAQPMRGMWLVAEAKSVTGQWVWAWSGYAPATGPYAGCTDVFEPVPVNLAGHHEVRLTAVSQIGVGDHVLTVKDNDLNDETWVATNEYFPLITASGRHDKNFGSSDARVNAAIALAWALAREDGNVAPMTLDVYNCNQPWDHDGDPATPKTCQGSTLGGAYRHGPSPKEMYIGEVSELTLAFHELGHAIRAHAGSKQVPFNYDFDQSSSPPSECPAGAADQHFQTSDEATSAAINEGFADYYAAVILNKTNEADAFLFGTYDWDHDDSTVFEPSEYFSLERAPTPFSPSTMNRDYWDHECSQAETNLSSEYDWARGFWDLDTDEGLTFQIILDVFVSAVDEPTTDWEEDVGSCGLDCPWVRMWAWAYGTDDSQYGLSTDFIGAAWDNQCDNGICR